VAAPAAAPPVVRAAPESQVIRAAPEPQVEPELVTGPLELPIVVASWQAVVELVRADNAMLAALLADARPTAVSERELTVAFPGGAAFLKRKAEQDDYRRAASEALRTVTGHRLALRYELREAEEEVQQDDGSVLSGEELVKRFMEEFDAEEIDPEEEKAST
jgi:hypothetical protein